MLLHCLSVRFLPFYSFLSWILKVSNSQCNRQPTVATVVTFPAIKYFHPDTISWKFSYNFITDKVNHFQTSYSDRHHFEKFWTWRWRNIREIFKSMFTSYIVIVSRLPKVSPKMHKVGQIMYNLFFLGLFKSVKSSRRTIIRSVKLFLSH